MNSSQATLLTLAIALSLAARPASAAARDELLADYVQAQLPGRTRP